MRLGRALSVNNQWLESSHMAQGILPTISEKDFYLFILLPGYQTHYRKVMFKTQILSVPQLCSLFCVHRSRYLIDLPLK